jgi:phosphoenolpyruvate-protein phosphotransferase (PTS system enzyme I)
MSKHILRGIGASGGVARGTAFVVVSGDRGTAPRRSIQPAEVETERTRFEAALTRAESELTALQHEVSERIGQHEADIFGAQVLVLRDRSFHEQVLHVIRDELVNAEAALSQIIDTYTRSFEAIADLYLRERAADVRDVGRRVLSALAERQPHDGHEIPQGAILVAEELLPSATARLELGCVRAFVTERGNRFSHSAILARSIGMPALAGVPGAATKIQTGDPLIVDGVSGTVFVHPDAAVQREYARLAEELRHDKDELRCLAGVPSVTLDGTPVPLLANVNKLADTEVALQYGAAGIGLYRTEFAFSVRSGFPTEDEQYGIFSRAAERFHPRKVVFRLVDLGGDKLLPYFPLPPSRNPSLGQRGVRLLLRHPEVLKPQLRALLRVSADHPVSLLLPVVGGLEEVRQARQVLRQVQDELAAAGQRFDPHLPVGAMIEVPSAALMVRTLAREVDFLSLGTNDLVQYVLAADREDESVAAYYQPLHPGVLRLLHTVVEAARSAERELTICGEMAGDPHYIELLLGLGLRAFSVAPGEMLEAKAAIRRTRLDEARELARRALELGSVAEIEALLDERRKPAG